MHGGRCCLGPPIYTWRYDGKRIVGDASIHIHISASFQVVHRAGAVPRRRVRGVLASFCRSTTTRDMTNCYVSKNTESRLEHGDRGLEGLQLSNSIPEYVARSGGNRALARWSPKSNGDVTRLGEALARVNQSDKCPRLKYLEINGIDTFDRLLVANETFLESLSLISRIDYLTLIRCGSAGSVGKLLDSFVGAGRHSIRCIQITRCEVNDDDISLLGSALQKISRIDSLNLGIDLSAPTRLSMIVDSLRHVHVKDLAFYSCGITCIDPLRVILRGPLCQLSLYGDAITKENACALARALEGNTTLTQLNHQFGEDDLLDPFRQLLCDKKTPTTTFLSNHTLYMKDRSGRSISHAADLNRLSGLSCRHKTIFKILMTHSHIDCSGMTVFGLKLLPGLVSWFDEATSLVGNGDVSLGQRNSMTLIECHRLNALYGSIRRFPIAVVDSTGWETPRDDFGRKVNSVFRLEVSKVQQEMKAVRACILVCTGAVVILAYCANRYYT